MKRIFRIFFVNTFIFDCVFNKVGTVMKNNIPSIMATIVLLISLMATFAVSPAFAASDHYQIGYNDGCSGTVVPGHHTRFTIV